MSVQRSDFRLAALSAGLAVLGGASVAFYYGAKHYGVGKIGQPTDIGGGAFVLFGAMTLTAALVVAVVAYLQARRSRKGRGRLR